MKKHGQWGTPTYFVWAQMLQRCNNPKSPVYEYYGGRGIKVCRRWHDYSAFLQDMGNAPLGLTLERKINSGHYCKRNCCWATRKVQANNRRDYPQNRKRTPRRTLTFKGETLGMSEWARRLGIYPSTLTMRLQHGWSVQRALSTPLKER